MRPQRPGALRERAEKLAAETNVRLVLEIPPSVRRALKVRAAERGKTIRDYVLELLEKDGVR